MKALSEILFKGYLSKRKSPINLRDEDINIFKNELEKNIDDTILYEGNKITATYDGILLDNFKIHESSIANKKTRKSLKYKYPLSLLIYGRKRKINSDKKAFIITNYYWAGYFHWITETLTKLVAAGDLLKDSILVLPKPKHDFHSASLKPFLIDNLFYLQPKEYIRHKTTRFISYTAPPGNYNKHYLSQVASTIKNYYANKENEHYNKIYISRKRATKRKITNELEVETLLKSFGYKCLIMEDLAFAEQVNICSNAKSLISLHGAGLTNMIFMNSGGKVVELRQEGEVQNNCYYTLASDSELQYYYLICKKENKMEENHSANVSVDIVDLKHLVEAMQQNE